MTISASRLPVATCFGVAKTKNQTDLNNEKTQRVKHVGENPYIAEVVYLQRLRGWKRACRAFSPPLNNLAGSFASESEEH